MSVIKHIHFSFVLAFSEYKWMPWLHFLLSVADGSLVWVAGISAHTLYRQKVYTSDNEASCYHISAAQKLWLPDKPVITDYDTDAWRIVCEGRGLCAAQCGQWAAEGVINQRTEKAICLCITDTHTQNGSMYRQEKTLIIGLEELPGAVCNLLLKKTKHTHAVIEGNQQGGKYMLFHNHHWIARWDSLIAALHRAAYVHADQQLFRGLFARHSVLDKLWFVVETSAEPCLRSKSLKDQQFSGEKDQSLLLCRKIPFYPLKQDHMCCSLMQFRYWMVLLWRSIFIHFLLLFAFLEGISLI